MTCIREGAPVVLIIYKTQEQFKFSAEDYEEHWAEILQQIEFIARGWA